MGNFCLREIIVDSQKYFDRKQKQPIDVKKDGCPLTNWGFEFGKAKFALHPKGFLVFLAPNEIESSDEYRKEDPYTVEENIDSEFHRRRIECTLELVKEALQALPASARILDLGCGQGHITSRIQQAFPQAEFSAVDYSISAIDYAVEHFSNIDFIVANAYQPPYCDHYFDIVICNNLWEHVPDPLSLLKNVSEIMKPGGFLIISTPSRYRFSNLLRVIRGRPVTLMSDHHVTEYSVGQVIEQCRYGGYQIRRIFSKPLRLPDIKTKLVYPFISWLLAFTGSHHQLESTAFYLAQKMTIANNGTRLDQ